MKTRLQWLKVSFPAALLFGAFGASAGLSSAGPWGAFWVGLAFVGTFLVYWMSAALPTEPQLAEAFGGCVEPTLHRSWQRAFDEVHQPVPRIPSMMVIAEAQPVFLVWRTRSGEAAVLLSRTWHLTHSEQELREHLRSIPEVLDDPNTWLRSAKAWWVMRLSKYFRSSVLETLWGTRNPAMTTPREWVLQLPVSAWVFWALADDQNVAALRSAGQPWCRHVAIHLSALSGTIRLNTKSILSIVR